MGFTAFNCREHLLRGGRVGIITNFSSWMLSSVTLDKNFVLGDNGGHTSDWDH